MSDLTKAEQMIAEKTVCVMLMRGTLPEGGRIYAYIAVRADRISEFMRAQTQPDFNPDDYGVIIESGEGEPDDEVRGRMERDYGFNHETMAFLSPDGQ